MYTIFSMRVKEVKIFIPEYIPMQNKGEEAILRGYESILEEGLPANVVIKWGILDDVDTIKIVENITIFPRNWIENSKWPSKYYRYNRILWDFLYILGIEGKISHVSKVSKYKELADFWNSMDMLIVGHDGYFKPACGIFLLKAKKAGKKAGILGSGFYPLKYGTWRERIQRNIYAKTMAQADFSVFREKTAYNYMKTISKHVNPLPLLSPDPAFVMKPAEDTLVQKILNQYDWYRSMGVLGKLFIGVTVCQNDVHILPFKNSISWNADMSSYWKYLAHIFDMFIDSTKESLVFLPHSIVPGKNDDVKNAYNVIQHMKRKDKCHVLEEDLPAASLKGIIKHCDFLIGQRTHSLIGSSGVCTPAVALTSTKDGRTHEILEDFAGFKDNIIDIDILSSDEAGKIIIKCFNSRKEIKERQCKQYEIIKKQSKDVVDLVRSTLDSIL